MFGGDKWFFRKRKDDAMTDYAKQREVAQKAEATETKAHNENTKIKLAEYEQRDRQEMEDARTYKPQVSIKEYPTGAFFCVDAGEWPLRYVESIEAGEKGFAPYKQHSSVYAARVHACKAGRASIKVTTASGQEHAISCNRFQLDPLLDAMRTAWKEGRGTA